MWLLESNEGVRVHFEFVCLATELILATSCAWCLRVLIGIWLVVAYQVTQSPVPMFTMLH